MQIATNNIAVGIPTYKRPNSLLRLVESINNADIPKNYSIIIIAADNDPNRSGENVLNSIKASCSHEIIIRSVTTQGISSIRNCLLTTAFEELETDYLVMVDDDEIVSKGWLIELIKTQKQTNADIVGGLKKPQFKVEAEPWMPTSDVFFYEPRSNKGLCSRLVSTDNLLIKKTSYIDLGKPKFDVAFDLTGGGDTEYLHRVSKQGANLGFSKEALTYEIIPESRMNYKWAHERSYRIGIGLARISMLHDTTILKKALHWAKLIAILMASLVLVSLTFYRNDSHIEYKLMFYKQIGKIHGHMGKRVYPYK